MDRIYNPDRDVDDRRFTEGDIDLDIEATPLAEAWLNAVQEELCAAITVDDEKLDPASQAQLRKVIARRALQVAVQRGEHNRCVNSGQAEKLIGSFTPAISELTDGLTVQVLCLKSNSQATVTFTPNADLVAASALVSIKGTALTPGAIPVGWADLRYVKDLGAWTLLNRVETPVEQKTCTVEVFSSSGTYVKPEGAKSIHLKIIGGAQGGGNGSATAVGTSGEGGSGGNGPASLELNINAEELSATCAVIVGKGGKGAAGLTLSSAGPGAHGTESRFQANSSIRYIAAGGASWIPNAPGMFPGGTGGRGANSSRGLLASANFVTPGGGGGGGVWAERFSAPGANATPSCLYRQDGFIELGGAAAGGDALNAAKDENWAKHLFPGIAGAGGGGNAQGNGGKGGDGSGYGAPGGGGGATYQPFRSGSGGAGSDGVVVVTTYF